MLHLICFHEQFFRLSKERQDLLEAYKLQIANLKKKLQNDLDEEENDKTIE